MRSDLVIFLTKTQIFRTKNVKIMINYNMPRHSGIKSNLNIHYVMSRALNK